MRKPRQKSGGVWKFVPDTDRDPAEVQRELKEEVDEMLITRASLCPDFHSRLGVVKERENYLPGKNKVPEDGAWILVKDPPATEYTVPPMSIWFATPWPMQDVRLEPHRVKIVTPRGDLGIYPCEYSMIEHPEKYFEFVGDGMEAKFFGNEEGIPRDKLFYLRSRGISKRDAMVMLIGEIKAHGVLWIESTRETVACFNMEFPDDKRNATLAI